MGFTFGGESYKSWADSNAESFKGYSSASENFAASVGQVVDEELSISSLLHQTGISERDQKIRDMAAKGEIDKELMDMYTTGNPGRGKKVDYNSIAEYLNWSESVDQHIDTDEELTTARDKELANRRKYRDEVFNTALTGGKVAQFAGSIVASGLDPINIAAMGLTAPVAGVQATSKAMYALSMAGRGAAVNAAVAVPIEPFIHSWKEEIGATYTLEDSLFNIGASGILGGAVSGISAALSRQFTGNGFLTKERASILSKYRNEDLNDLTGRVSNSPQPKPGSPGGATAADLNDIAQIYTSDSTGLRADQFADVDKLLSMLDDRDISWISTKDLSNFGDTLQRSELPSQLYSGIQDFAGALRAQGIDSIDVKYVKSFLNDIHNKRAIGAKFENMSFKRLTQEFKKLGLDEDQAEHMARFVDEANKAKDPKMSAEDFVRKTEESQKHMDLGEDKDLGTRIDIEETENLDALYSEVPEDLKFTNEDGTQTTFKELEAGVDADIEELQKGLGCLNG